MNCTSLNKAIQANDWTYVGEGNQNLVVRYTGSDESFVGKVLRVVKSNSKNQNVDKQSLLSKKDFVDRIIRPLLGEEYVLNLQPISTSEIFLHQLATNIQPARPLARLETQIITDAPISFIMADLTQIWPNNPTLTFELKPKWGFKPSSDTVHKIKTQYCRYCMHSHFRKTQLNGYCPLDLYSDTPSLLHNALDILLKKAPLEKTLRVSINGTCTSLTNSDPDAEYRSLLKINSQDELLPKILEAILIQDPILLKLKTLQADFDELDVEKIMPLYQELENIVADNDLFEKVVDKYKKRKQDSNTPITDLQRILEYVLSMTFKDCSIMINVIPKRDKVLNHKLVALRNGLIFYYDIKVIDTDLKKVDKIPYWYKLDQAIVKHAIETCFTKERACYYPHSV